MSEVDIDHVAR